MRGRFLIFAIPESKGKLMKFANNIKSTPIKIENKPPLTSEDEANLTLTLKERQFLENFELSGEGEAVTKHRK